MPELPPDEFAADADRFVDDLNAGVPITVALEAANDVVHHPDVVAAATAMLAEIGALDMTRLASQAGMSRASLYRYYPDKAKLEAEIAGIGIDGMVRAASVHAEPADKFRAAAGFLSRHPGEAAAMIPFAAMASVEVLGMTVEKITGDAASAPLIVGIAVMAATPTRHDGDAQALNRYIDEAAELLR